MSKGFGEYLNSLVEKPKIIHAQEIVRQCETKFEQQLKDLREHDTTCHKYVPILPPHNPLKLLDRVKEEVAPPNPELYHKWVPLQGSQSKVQGD